MLWMYLMDGSAHMRGLTGISSIVQVGN
jgi:hypothetical protein